MFYVDFRMSLMEVQDNCKMRNSNKYVLRELQNEFNVEVQDNCEMRIYRYNL